MYTIVPGGATIRRKKTTDEAEEGPQKKKSAGKGVKKNREVEVDAELFTKGPFSGTQIIADDLGPDIVLPEPTEEEETEKPKAPSTRRDMRKQAAPVSAKVLEFKKPTGKVALTEGVTVKELADKLGVKANDLMKHLLMKKGLMVSINQPLGADLALEIAKDLEIDAEVVSFETAAEMVAMEKTASKGTTPSSSATCSRTSRRCASSCRSSWRNCWHRRKRRRGRGQRSEVRGQDIRCPLSTVNSRIQPARDFAVLTSDY